MPDGSFFGPSGSPLSVLLGTCEMFEIKGTKNREETKF
jgi:hypothetical protein